MQKEKVASETCGDLTSALPSRLPLPEGVDRNTKDKRFSALQRAKQDRVEISFPALLHIPSFYEL